MSDNVFTYAGKVDHVGEEKTFKSGFKKRELVCYTTGGKYADYAVFEASNKAADAVAGLKKGADVVVSFRLSGRAWDDQRTGTTKWFGSATAFKVMVGTGTEVPSVPEPTMDVADSCDDADLPF